jgi:hypothetical protein
LTDYLTTRLLNWGRAMRQTTPPKHCASVEWRFVQHRTLTEGEEEYRRTPTMPLDLADAAIIEKAWTRIADKQHKALLLQRFVWHSRDERICQRLRIPPVRVNGTLIYLLIALRAAKDALTRELDGLQLSHDHVRRQADDSADRRKTDATMQASAPID